MTEKEFLDLFEEVIEADPGTISIDDYIENIGSWNSIAIMSFIALIDENFDVILSPEGISEVETIKDLYTLVCDSISE